MMFKNLWKFVLGAVFCVPLFSNAGFRCPDCDAELLGKASDSVCLDCEKLKFDIQEQVTRLPRWRQCSYEYMLDKRSVKWVSQQLLQEVNASVSYMGWIEERDRLLSTNNKNPFEFGYCCLPWAAMQRIFEELINNKGAIHVTNASQERNLIIELAVRMIGRQFRNEPFSNDFMKHTFNLEPIGLIKEGDLKEEQAHLIRAVVFYLTYGVSVPFFVLEGNKRTLCAGYLECINRDVGTIRLFLCQAVDINCSCLFSALKSMIASIWQSIIDDTGRYEDISISFYKYPSPPFIDGLQ